jgi:hypothetical protein
VRVRKFACANVLFLMSHEIVHGSYRVIRSAGAMDRLWFIVGRGHPLLLARDAVKQ